MKACRIRLEYGKTNPDKVCVLESGTPAISWAVEAAGGRRQSACRLTVTRGGETAWDTGTVRTGSQSAVYGGTPLIPGEVYSLSVRVWDDAGQEGEPAFQQFCLGTLERWDAPWICRPGEADDAVVSFARDFAVKRRVVSACLFVCGLGYHNVYLNGHDVLTDPMSPPYSEYEKRCYYSVLPGLEGLLTEGENRIGIEVAPGWRTPLNVCYELTKRIPDYTGRMQLTAALRLTYEDASEQWLTTGGDWQCFVGPAVYSNIFMGERFEAARLLPGWSMPGTKLPDALKAELCDAPGGVMRPDTLEPVVEQETYRALSAHEVEPGIWGVDFAQNIAGVCRIRIPRGIPAGTVIELSHMEFLKEDARLFLEQLRNAASVDRYVAAGGGRDPEYWQPRYTYHGFRYAEVKGYPGPLSKDDIQAVSLYTAIASRGGFRCGNALVSAIHKNVVQTEKANIHSVLTDCPQRDERMGWLNDATVRFEETPYNFDIGRLFPKVVRDCMDVQGSGGEITCTAPFSFGARPADPVCSSYLLAGYMAWMHTGNRGILAEGYPGFKAWNEFLESKSENGIVQYSYYGDWAAPAYACQSEEYAVSAVTPGILMSTGYHYYNAVLLSRMADALGMPEEAACHREKAESVRQAFLDKWWDPASGTVGTGSQGCQAFALWLDILPPEGRQKAADRLHDDLLEKQYRFTTGNLCTRYMMDVLARYGYMEDAWALLTREEYPSLGFMIQHEATTVWERFELKKNPTMNSHNHPMYGAVGYWFYAYLAGLTPLTPGWREFSVKPYAPEKLLSASAEVETPYGDATVRWVKRYGEFHLYVDVPHGTRARVELPGGGEAVWAEAGFHHFSRELIVNGSQP